MDGDESPDQDRCEGGNKICRRNAVRAGANNRRDFVHGDAFLVLAWRKFNWPCVSQSQHFASPAGLPTYFIGATSGKGSDQI